MKRKMLKTIAIVLAIIFCTTVSTVTVGFYEPAMAACSSTKAVESLWRSVQNGETTIDFALEAIVLDATTVYASGNVLLTHEELEAAINNGCFVDYIDYFKANGCISQDFVYAPTSSSSSSSSSTSTPKKEYTEEEIAAAWKETSRTEATCLEAGVINYKNSITGETKTEEIQALGHDYEVVTEVSVTCEEKGVDVYTCAACGDSYEQETPALGHSFTVTSKTDATCTTAGSVVSVCDTCEKEQSEVIEAKGHTEGSVTVLAEATLFEDGEEAVFCTVCEEKLASEVIPATCPVPLGVIIMVVVVAVAGVMIIVRKKKSK